MLTDKNEAYQKVKAATVAICLRSTDGKLIPFGSGVNIDPNGMIVTCAHVIAEAQVHRDPQGNAPALPRSAGGIQSGDLALYDLVATFTILEKDHIELAVCRFLVMHGLHDLDIAVAKLLPDEPLPFIDIGDSDELYEGQPVFTCGFPLGPDLQPNDPIGSLFLHGIVSGIRPHHKIFPRRELLLDMSINPGNSGGPLSPENSPTLVGIVNARVHHQGIPTGIACAIPSGLISPVVSHMSSLTTHDIDEMRKGNPPPWM